MTARGIFVHATALLLVSVGIASAQKAAKCSDVPIRVTIVPIEGGVLSGDSKGSVYNDGVDGVYNTVIHVCGTNPSYDATMGLITSRRSLGFTFPAPLDGSVLSGPGFGPEPLWAGSSFLAKPFMNVRSILWGRKNGASTFTTRMGFSFFSGPGDKADYAIQFPGADNDAGVPATANSNIPNETTPVTVQDVPGNCRTGGSTLDSWIVTVNAPGVGVLMKSVNSGPSLHSGQYTMPFKLLIEARSCVPF